MARLDLVGTGTKFQKETATPGTYASIPSVISISGPNISKPEIDMSDLDSTQAENKGGLTDPGTATIEMGWRPSLTEHQDLLTDALDPTSPIKNYRILWIDGRSLTFPAYLQGFPFSMPTNQRITISVPFRIAGEIVADFTP